VPDKGKTSIADRLKVFNERDVTTMNRCTRGRNIKSPKNSRVRNSYIICPPWIWSYERGL